MNNMFFRFLTIAILVLFRAGYSADKLTDWIHSWNEPSSSTALMASDIPVAGTQVLPDVKHPKYASAVICVDRFGTIYFGEPKKIWAKGMSAADIGVPFVALFDGIGQIDANSKVVYTSGAEPVISFVDYKLSGLPENAKFKAQLSYYVKPAENNTSFTINYGSNLKNGSFKGVVPVFPNFNLTVSNGSALEMKDVAGNFSKTYNGESDEVLISNGIIDTKKMNNFGSWATPKDVQVHNGKGLDDPIAISVAAGSVDYNGATSTTKTPISTFDWSQFSELQYIAKTSGDQNYEFRIWPFEDEKNPGTNFGLNDKNIVNSAEYAAGSLNMADVYKNVAESNPELLVSNKLYINRIKVMLVSATDNYEGGSVSFQELKLVRSQPMSYLWTYSDDVIIPPPAQGYSLNVAASLAASSYYQNQTDANGTVTVTGPVTKSALLVKSKSAFADLPAGVYTVSISDSSSTFQPASYSWVAGSSMALNFVQYHGAPRFLPNPPSQISYTEGANPVIIDLNTLASDPTSSSLVWSMGTLLNVPSNLVKLNAINRTLTIGDVSSDWNGPFDINLSVRNQYGASQTAVLKVTVVPENDAPVILKDNITLMSGGFLTIDLDKTGASAFARDVDDPLTALGWTVTRVAGTPDGLTFNLEGRSLKVTAAAGIVGTFQVDLKVSDPGLASTTKRVTVVVQSPAMEILGLTGSQDANSNIQVDFSSRYCKESVTLPGAKISVKDLTGKDWLFPAILSVIAAPTEYQGVFNDGIYQVIVSSKSFGSLNGSGKKYLAELVNQTGGLSLGLSLACDGRSKSVSLTASGVDFSKPIATVSLTQVAGTNDPKGRKPGMDIKWSWDREGVASTSLQIRTTNGDLIKDLPLGSSDRSAIVDDLVDGVKYQITVYGKDLKGNKGSGQSTLTTTSGIYAATIKLDDDQKTQVTGQVCINLLESPAPATCMPLNPAVKGSYIFDNLVLGQYNVVVNDDRWVLEGKTGSFSIDHADSVWTGKLIPSDFIVQKSLFLSEEQGNGDLVLKFKTKNTFVNELPLNVKLTWDDGGADGVATTANAFALLPAASATFSLDQDIWTLRWKRSVLKQYPTAMPLFNNESVRKWTSVEVSTQINNGQIFRSSIGNFTSVYKKRRNVSAFVDPSIDSLSRSIDASGNVTWAMRSELVHGSELSAKICLPSTDLIDEKASYQYAEGCIDGKFEPTSPILAYKLDARSAFSIPGLDNLMEDPVSGGMVVTDYSTEDAGSQWKFWASDAGDYDLQFYWTSHDNINTFDVTLDSGKTWKFSKTKFVEKWNSLGRIPLKKGWNSIGLKLEGTAAVKAIYLNPIANLVNLTDGSYAALPIGSALREYSLNAALDNDRVYSSRFSLVDEYGANVQNEEWFRVSPDGAFSDAVLFQEEATGDLVIKTTQSSIDAVGLGNTSIVLPGSTSRIKPSSIGLNSGGGILIRLNRKDIPESFLQTSSRLHGNNLSIKLVTTGEKTINWTERHCRYWGWSCKNVPYSRVDKTESTSFVNWTGSLYWVSGHDLRSLPNITISQDRQNSIDSIHVKVEGLESLGDGYRGTAAGVLKATWTPGSNCASATSVDIPFRNVFASNASGEVMFRPVLEAAYTSKIGEPTLLTEDALSYRHQWLNLANGGGGFFPAAIAKTTADQAAQVGFLVRGTMATSKFVRLWVKPGSGVGDLRSQFLYRLRPEGTTNSTTLWQTGTAYSTAKDWQGQSTVLTLDTGLQVLEFKMIDAGVELAAVALLPESDPKPSVELTSLPKVGTFESPSVVRFSAPSLSPGTQHAFQIQAIDRWGNASTVAEFSASTAQPSEILPGVRLSIDPWDASGWLKNGSYKLQARLVTALPAGASASVLAKLYKKDDHGLPVQGSDVVISMTENAASGVWEGNLPALTGYASAPGQLDLAPHVAVEAWAATATSRGISSAIDFQVRADNRPANSTETIANGPVNSTLQFKVLQSWSEGGFTYANLSVPSMDVQEDDTGINLLVLRRAKIGISSGAISSVNGGTFASLHCHLNQGSDEACMDQAEHPLTVGRWDAKFAIQGLIYRSFDGALEISDAKVFDDQDRPARNSTSFKWNDAGLKDNLELSKDRFWFGNVIASTTEEAFGLEACRTTISPVAGAVSFSLRGCDEQSGPFLTFPLNMRTSGMWSVIGTAFDSLPQKYTLTWRGTPSKQWVGGVPSVRGTYDALSDVVISKSALKNAFGASLWGYDVKSYTFGQAGVTNLSFDLLFPETPVTPKVRGEFQRIAGFSGGSILSTSAVMGGKPVLTGPVLSSSNAGALQLGQTLGLAGVTGWQYKYADGEGWTLVPVSATKQVYLTGPQKKDVWRIVDGGAADDTRFKLPFKTLVLGPGSFDQTAIGTDGTQSVKIDAGGGTIIDATLAVEPGDDGLMIQASDVSVTLSDFFTSRATKSPVSQVLSNVELSLTGEFQLKDIDAIGDLAKPGELDVKLAGYDVVSFLPTKKYQVMANRGRVFVRLFRPDVQLNVDNKAQTGTSVQTVVLTTKRIPVAVGASVPVPRDVNLLDKVGLGKLGELIVDEVQLDASAEIVNDVLAAKLGLQASTLIKLGSAFESLGLRDTKLPLKSMRLDLKAQSSNTANWATGADVSFETSPIGFAMDVGWTKSQIKSLFLDETNSGVAGEPAIIRLRTQGWPISLKYEKNQLKWGLQNWELSLTKDFPVTGLANTSFFLEKLEGTVNSSGKADITTISASGTREFPDGLAIAPGVRLLSKSKTPVSVSIKTTKNDGYFELKADQIEINNNIYDLSCGGTSTASLKIDFTGKLIGSLCFELTKMLPIYPLGSSDPEVYIPAPGPTDAKTQVTVGIGDGVVSFDIKNAHIISKGPVWEGQILNITNGAIKANVSVDYVDVLEASGKFESTFEKSFGNFTFNTQSIDLSVKDKVITVFTHPTLTLAGSTCTGNSVINLGFTAPMAVTGAGMSMDWNLDNGSLKCPDLAGFSATVSGLSAKGKLSSPNIKIDQIEVLFGRAANFLRASWDDDFEPNDIGTDNKGVRLNDMAYDGINKKFKAPTVELIGYGSAEMTMYLQIKGIGAGVKGTFDFAQLLDIKDPGVKLTNVDLMLPKALGGKTVPTNFGILFNGKSPYAHPYGDASQLKFTVSKINLMVGQSFDEATLIIKKKRKKGSTEREWVLEGNASLTLSGAIEKMAVEVAMKAPSKDDCRSGVCKAVLTLKLAEGSRIPLGSSGFYISGLKGGFYDGDYSPDCAKECTGQDMPKGMKVDLSLFLELEDPSVANGSAGFWVHLEKIDFGVNAKLKIVGKADAYACLAVMHGGSTVHGKVTISLEEKLGIKGYFIMDIWEDNGSKFAAEAGASVGLNRAAIIKCRWFKFPRSRWWMGPVIARMGAFQGGNSGFTTGIRALGKTWGAGYVGGFILGNVGKYKLASPFTNSTSLVDGATVAKEDYSMVPLGLDLKGDEVVTVAVGSAFGTDWLGARVALVDGAKSTEIIPASGLNSEKMVTSYSYVAAETYENEANTSWMNDGNIHTMTWTNPGMTNTRPYIAIPRKRGTAVPTEEETEELKGQPVVRKDDDVQIIATYADPIVDVQASKCSDGKDICFNGTVKRFKKVRSDIKRTYTTDERAVFDVSTPQENLTDKVIASQKHQLRVWAASKDTTGFVYDTSKTDSSAVQELDLNQFVGPNQGTQSLADFSCATESAPNTITLNNCRMKATTLPSGTYSFMVGAVVLELDPSNPTQEVLVSEVMLDSSRRWVKNSQSLDAEESAGLFEVENAVTGKVEDLVVFGSALTGQQSKSDETSTFFVRWKPIAHRDVVGYKIVATYADGGSDTSWSSRRARWGKTLAKATQYKVGQKIEDSTANIDLEKVLQAPTETAFLRRRFEMPTSVTVIPRARVLKRLGGLINLASAQGVWTKGAGADVLGVRADPSAAPKPVITVDTTSVALALDSTYHVGFTVGASATPTGGLANHGARAELQWVNDANEVIGNTDTLGYPKVSLLRDEWDARDSLRNTLLVTAPGEDLLCPKKWDTTFCTESNLIRKGTQIGEYKVRLRVWNQGRLADDQFQESYFKITVKPPVPQLNIIDPDYLIGGRPQRNNLNISGLWNKGGKDPEIRFLDASGQPIAFSKRGDHNEWLPVTAYAIPAALIDTGRLRSRKIRWQLPKLSQDSLTMEISNFDKSGNRWKTEKKIRFVQNIDFLACRDSLLLPTMENYDLGMDFVGFYPKVLRAGSEVFAKFSEVHNPEDVNFIVNVVPEGKPPVLVQDYSASPDGVTFKIPESVEGSAKVDVILQILDASAGERCQGKTWSRKIKLLPKFTESAYPTPLKLESWFGMVGIGMGMSQRDAVRPLFGWPQAMNQTLRPTEQVEWMRGTPFQGMERAWQSGLPTLGHLVQPDQVQLRIRETETNAIVWRGTFLVQTPPRRLELSTGSTLLERQVKLPLGTKLRVGFAPKASYGQDGSSRGVQECRWNNDDWAVCPSELVLDLKTQGTLESRMAWTVRTTSGTEKVYEPVQRWNVQAISLEESGLKTQPLTLDGKRLAWVLEDTVMHAVVRLRRTGAQLARWDATAPLVRDEQGTLLPQATETYDPAAQVWDAWVRLDWATPDRTRQLVLSFGDLAVPESPWTGVQRQAGSLSAAGQVGGAVLTTGQSASQNLAPIDANPGWSTSLWLRWNGQAGPICTGKAPNGRMPEFALNVLADGSLRLNYQGTTWSTKPVLDASEPMLVGVDWVSRDGSVHFWVNGQQVASRGWTGSDEGEFPQIAAQWTCAATWCDELRWNAPLSKSQWSLRWESERSHSDLWEPWTDLAPERPFVERRNGGRVRRLEAGERMWRDREAVTLASAWSGASWLPGLAWPRNGELSGQGSVATLPGAKLCAVDVNAPVGDGWVREGALPTNRGELGVWCRTLVTGEANLVAGQGMSPAWFVLPAVATGSETGASVAELPFWPGEGNAKPNKLPSLLVGGKVQPGAVNGSSVDFTPKTGKVLVIAMSGSPLAQYLESQGWAKVQTVLGTNADGQAVSWIVYAPISGKVTLPTDLASGALVVRLPSVRVRPARIDVGHREVPAGEHVVLPDGTDAGTLVPPPAVVPLSCKDWTTTAEYTRPVRLHLWSPFALRVPSSVNWTLMEVRDSAGVNWAHWIRSLPRGSWSEDFSSWLPGTCARYTYWAEDVAEVAPDWALGETRLRGIGGTGTLKGGRHLLSKLELEFAAAQLLEGSQYRMRLGSTSGMGDKLVSQSLGLGSDRLVHWTDAATKETRTVSVQTRLPLVALRAERLDADSVVVHTTRLESKGTVRVFLRQNGGKSFAGGGRMVLFRDRDGDATYTSNVDQALGSVVLPKLGAGDSTVLRFMVDGTSREFPEELFFAWIETPGTPEVQVGDYVTKGGNQCHDRKSMAWGQLTSERPLGVSQEDLPEGTQVLRAHLRDTDGNGRWNAKDSTDLLWVTGDRVWRSSASGAVEWSRQISGATRSEDLVVRDLDGNGSPEILVGTAVLDLQGRVLWDLSTSNENRSLDADEDGLVDRYTVNGTCRQLELGNGMLAWSSGCSTDFRTFLWKDLARHPSGCGDLSLSALRQSDAGAVVRVANAGTITARAGILLELHGANGSLLKGILTPELKAGTWADIPLGVPGEPGMKAALSRASMEAVGLMDSDPTNDLRTLGEDSPTEGME